MKSDKAAGTEAVGRKQGEHMKPNAMFTTLKENKDFRRLYHRGKSYVSPVLVTYVMKNRKAGLRIGFTTSKKIGIAVRRNRSRRIMRGSVPADRAGIENRI